MGRSTRPVITQGIIDIIAGRLDRQNEKGMNKYGVSIDEVTVDVDGVPYDWRDMALEELVDCIQYLMKENVKLNMEIRELKTVW